MIDAEGGQCLGCYRTLPEIAAWGTMDPQLREQIMEELDDRMAAAFERADAEEPR